MERRRAFLLARVAVLLYPQRFVEVMARSRPVSPSSEVLPESVDELAVGLATARAIGWAR